MSIYTEYTSIYCIAAVGVVMIGNRIFLSDSGDKEDEEQIFLMNGSLKPFLSNYRAAMMLATCTAILAVDFNMFFPVRFAKCEEFGISLMDVGVGGFIFSSALTSAKSRRSSSQSSSSTSTSSSSSRNRSTKPSTRSVSSIALSFPSRMLQSLKMVIPLLVLGLGRFSIIKLFGYQEHVTEYGMHWNFFMTLAGITLLVAALNIPFEYSSIAGVVVLVLYQYVLEGMGLSKWIIEAPRVDFFSQNREGILSCLGYLALYWFGQHVGAYLMQSRTRKQWWRALFYLLAGGALLWLSASSMRYFLDMYSSRRMVNMPYALYTLACNFVILSAFLIVDLVSTTEPNPLVDSVATKRNSQLVIFTLVCHTLIPIPFIMTINFVSHTTMFSERLNLEQPAQGEATSFSVWA
jgi:phosphatidylinositol glycan class W